MPAKLQWVRVGEEVVHVGQYAHLKPRDRPKASCPVCGDQVVMKLGAKVAHHCAHKPDATCAATSGETAVHLNCKLHIARNLEQELARAQQDGDEPRLLIKHACGSKTALSNNPCAVSRSLEWVKGWDQVAVELRVGNRQPDVTLLRDGHAIAGIEVHVTNAVNEEKAADLLALGLPWIEVKGHQDFYDGDRPWSAMVPLPVTSFSDSGCWKCQSCQRQATEKAKRQWAENNGWHDRLCRVVDFYYSSGKRYREMYVVQHLLKDGQEIGFLLKSSSKGDILLTVSQDRPDPMKRIASCFRHSVNKQAASLVDDSMRWTQPGHPLVLDARPDLDPMRSFYKYEWDKNHRAWRRRRKFSKR